MQLDFPHQQNTFIVAVSGGVDSVVLLHMLIQNYPNNKYIVAHIDHGIREDSAKDRALVNYISDINNLTFEYAELHLGASASEAEARARRYEYLQHLKNKHNALAIITAHHQDDVLETMFINLIRGTGRRGVASLKSTQDISRLLLHVKKTDIYDYANLHKLQWNEDSTNSDKKFLRNKIRHDVVGKMQPEHKEKALDIINNTNALNENIDREINILLRKGLHKGTPVLNRAWFSLLPHDISAEVVHVLLRQNGAKEIDKKTVEKTVVAIKTMQPGKQLQLSGLDIVFTKRSARFISHGKTDEKQV